MYRVRFPLVSALIALALGALLPAPAGAADLVIYRTPAGRLVLSNRPLPTGVELFFRVPDRTQPAGRSADGGAVQAPAHQALSPATVPPGTVPAPTPHLPPILREQMPTPRATTVDTVALALVTRGMSAADVRGTLGGPERVVLLDPVVRVSSERSSATAGRVERSVWVYTGTAPGGGALIWFVNGHVERVERVR